MSDGVGSDRTKPVSGGPLVPGLTDPRPIALERFAIRTREASVTLSAWRLTVSSSEGDGAIVRIDGDPAQLHFRGEGIFLGWPRERLEAAYAALQPQDSTPDLELNQLG